jgi:hypothetical protein
MTQVFQLFFCSFYNLVRIVFAFIIPGVNPTKLWFLCFSDLCYEARPYFLMVQTLKLNNKKRKKSLFYEEKSLVGLAPATYKDIENNTFHNRTEFVTYLEPHFSCLLFCWSWKERIYHEKLSGTSFQRANLDKSIFNLSKIEKPHS